MNSNGDMVSSKGSRVAGKSERSATGSGSSSRNAIQPCNNDINNSKNIPEKRNSPSTCVESSPRKILRRRAIKTEEDEDTESEINPDDIINYPVEDENVVDTVCEDVSVAVTGKKNIRGKVWRARNNDYVRYLCVDDGADYRPGGTCISLKSLVKSILKMELTIDIYVNKM